MVSVEDLRTRFPVQNVAPYGECIVVPGAVFDPDWEADFEEETEDTMVNGEPVTLIILGTKTESASLKEESGERLVYNPEEHNKLEKSFAEFPWSDEDESKLLRRMSELEGTVYERVTLLMPEFHGRSATSLRQKFYKLTGLKGSSKRKGRPKPEYLHAPWSAKEDDLLIEAWNKRMTRSTIALKVVGRSIEAVQNSLKQLQKLGRIKPRWQWPLHTKIPVGQSDDKQVHIPMHIPESTLKALDRKSVV